jgi:hypothetical protein
MRFTCDTAHTPRDIEVYLVATAATVSATAATEHVTRCAHACSIEPDQ